MREKFDRTFRWADYCLVLQAGKQKALISFPIRAFMPDLKGI